MSNLGDRIAPLVRRAVDFWDQAVQIWSDGGWAMWAIAVIALVMFAVGMHIHVSLRARGFQSVREETWRRWIDYPRERTGPIGRMLDLVTGGATLADTSFYFSQLRRTEMAPFERDLKVMRICVSAAPLVGLLGTVTGMLSTFSALASGSGGDKTMALVAAGISEALITTETGLVIALPGLFFQYRLTRRFDSYRAFIAHLEAVCAQAHYRKLRVERKQQLRQAAMGQITQYLRKRLTPQKG